MCPLTDRSALPAKVCDRTADGAFPFGVAFELSPCMTSVTVSRLFPDTRPDHTFGWADQPVPLEAPQEVQDSAVAHAKGVTKFCLRAWTLKRGKNVAASLLWIEGLSAPPALQRGSLHHAAS